MFIEAGSYNFQAQKLLYFSVCRWLLLLRLILSGCQHFSQEFLHLTQSSSINIHRIETKCKQPTQQTPNKNEHFEIIVKCHWFSVFQTKEAAEKSVFMTFTALLVDPHEIRFTISRDFIPHWKRTNTTTEKIL